MPALIAPMLFWFLLWGVGALATRGLGLRGVMWVLSGVPASVIMIAALGFAQAALDIPFGWPLLVGTAAAVSLLGVAARPRLRGTVVARPVASVSLVWAALAVSAGAGLLVLWVAGGGTFETASQTWDALFDTNAVRWVHESGSANPFALAQFVSPRFESYYPAAFHALGALFMSLAGGDAVVAANVAAGLVAGALGPSVLAASACLVFGTRARIALTALVFAAATMGMPWVPLQWGVLWATAVAGAFAPLVLAFFALAVGWAPAGRPRLPMAVGLLVSGAVVTVMHPRVGVIVATVLAAAWSAVRLLDLASAWRRGERAGWARSLAVALVPLVLALPIILFVGRTGTTVVARIWPVERGPLAEIVGYLLAGPAGTPAQPILAVAVVVGVWLAWRQRAWWLPAMFLAAVLLDIATATVMGFKPLNGIARFWYNDRHRTVVVPAAPGVWLAIFAVEQARLSRAWSRLGRWRRPALATAAAAICLGGWWSGQHVLRTSYIDAAHDPVASLVSPAEVAFYRDVARVVPRDDIVLNNAKDGSGLLYAYGGVRTAFYLGSNAEPSTDFALVLRSQFTTLDPPELCAKLANDGIGWVINSGTAFSNVVIPPDDAPGMVVPENFWATTPVLVDGERALHKITGCPAP